MPAHLLDHLFPARDQSFGAIVAALSSPESGPPGDNLITNEDSFPRACGELARRAPRDAAYLGVGPDQNLTYIAHARPSLAFVVDHRRRNLLVHLLHKALMALSPDRAAYLSRLTARTPAAPPNDPGAEALVAAFSRAAFDRERLREVTAEVAEFLRPFGVVGEAEWAELATIQARLAGPGMDARFLALRMYPTLGALIRTLDRDGRPAHLLASEARYRETRAAQLGDRVLPLVGDFAGPGTLPKLGAWLRARGIEVGTFYISDVEFFLLRAGRFAGYAENLAQLPWGEGAVVVRSSTRAIEHPERVAGDHGTTIVRRVAPFLDAAIAGRIATVEDLFAPEAPA